MDLEQKAIERIRLASDLSLKHYGKPLVCTYSGGKDSDVMLELFRRGAYHLRYDAERLSGRVRIPAFQCRLVSLPEKHGDSGYSY